MIHEPSQIACGRCKREYSLRLGEEPTLLCDRCAHEVAEVAWLMTPTAHPIAPPSGAALRGWKLVPLEPTREMQRAMYRELDGKHMPWVIEAVYRAMLDAAPPPPAGEGAK